jgi:hypothetical protein
VNIQPQNQESFATQVLKQFKFIDHPAVLVDGFANIDDTWQPPPPQPQCTSRCPPTHLVAAPPPHNICLVHGSRLPRPHPWPSTRPSLPLQFTLLLLPSVEHLLRLNSAQQTSTNQIPPTCTISSKSPAPIAPPPPWIQS